MLEVAPRPAQLGSAAAPPRLPRWACPARSLYLQYRGLDTDSPRIVAHRRAPSAAVLANRQARGHEDIAPGTGLARVGRQYGTNGRVDARYAGVDARSQAAPASMRRRVKYMP